MVTCSKVLRSLRKTLFRPTKKEKVVSFRTALWPNPCNAIANEEKEEEEKQQFNYP
jgi:hypothetical protein